MCLDIDGTYFFIVEFLHVKPGQGPAFVRTKLRNIKTGRILDKTWNSGANVEVEEVRVERHPCRFTSRDNSGCHFHNTETGEEFIIPVESIEGAEFLKSGDICQVLTDADTETVLTCEVSQAATLSNISATPDNKA